MLICSVGTPEIAGLTPIQAVEIVRGLRGLNVIGGDLVEVSEAIETILVGPVQYSMWRHITKCIVKGLLANACQLRISCGCFNEACMRN
jgi:arginase family enzyme